MSRGRKLKLVPFHPRRTFGVELEYISPCDREFLKACVVGAGESASVNGYQHDESKTIWSCKTDSSCGFELASRVLGSKTSSTVTLEGLNVLNRVAKVLQSAGAKVNDRCGTHVHVWIGDLHDEWEMKNVLAYWVKLEKTVMDMMPPQRKSNSYCPLPSAHFAPNESLNLEEIVRRGFRDRMSLNWGWYSRRKTVEFRVAEGMVDPTDIQNWVVFVLNFIERASRAPECENLNWLDFEESMKFLGLWNTDDAEEFFILDPYLADLRLWVLRRTQRYAGYRDREQMKEMSEVLLERLSP